MKTQNRLVKLLILIIIVVVVILISGGLILRAIENSIEIEYERKKELILSETIKYVTNNIENLYWQEDTLKITLGNLKEEKIFVSPIKNPRGGYFPKDTKVIVTRKSNDYIVYNITVPGELAHEFVNNSSNEGMYKYKNGAKRFVGPDPNNWIEFGELDGTALLWRIIKNDNNGIQIIYEGLKNGTKRPSANGRIVIENRITTAWDKFGSNKWDKPTTLKKQLDDWYNGLTIDKKNVQPINWCIGASGYGINYPKEFVPTSNFLETECSDGSYTGGVFKGKTAAASSVGMIRVSDYLSASNSESCVGSYFTVESSNDIDLVGHCGRKQKENVTTNYLLKSYYWWTLTASDKTHKNVWAVFPTGYVNVNSSNNTTMSVRPVINLKSSVQYLSGNGTIETPYKVK